VPLALAFGLTGCGTAPPSLPTGRVVDVTERDFSIDVSARRLSPGLVTFRVTNRGPDDHELIIVRDGTKLPLRADGITVDEERLESKTLGTLEPGQPDSVRELRVRLEKGRYVLICNMSGHFMGGMRAVVTVA
jgi:uncharacterized cupredoxin-like copper-binding protein